MSIKLRNYIHPDDYRKISEFLIAHHQSGNSDGNWLEPVWEYMHGHPYLDGSSLEKIGVWEDNGKIVSVVHYESRLGEAFFEFGANHHHLRKETLDYAEANLTGTSRKDERKYLNAFVNNNDSEFQALVQIRGYQKEPDGTRPLYRFDIPDPFPTINLPQGFRLTSLVEECDWAKVNRVIWRGFNHEGEPPSGEEELESRRRMFDTPKARRDLKIAIAAPDGDFVAFCGMFYEPNSKFAYVEPVATDPDYRRLGLGKAAVLEGIRRCVNLGAIVAYVGSDQEFYKALGFRYVFDSECWVKNFNDQN